ncbi:MAG TPA: trypsin-like peptidase domain-containing protein [Dongiaceae bacterium]
MWNSAAATVHGRQIVRLALAVPLLVIGLCLGFPTAAMADPAVQLKLITQPKDASADSRPIAIDSGDPVTIGTKLAVLVTAKSDAKVTIRYLPSDGAPSVLAQDISLKAGETRRLPSDNDWYQISSGAGEEQMQVEDASGVIAKAAYRIVDSSKLQIGNLTATSSSQTTNSIGGIDLGQYGDTANIVAKSKAVSETLEQAPAVPASGTRSIGSDVYNKVAPGVVLIINGDFIGSGAILNQNGLVITNHHVVAGADQVSVVFMPPAGTEVNESKAYDADVIRIDVIADLALIRIKNPPANLRLVEIGDPSSVQIGEEVNAIGHPHGEYWSYTRGYVSQIRPKYSWYDSHYDHVADVIQTQTPINPGNSGGPLLDDTGKLIGINSFLDPDAQGLNFAVSVDEVKRVLEMKGDRLADGSIIADSTSGGQDGGETSNAQGLSQQTSQGNSQGGTPQTGLNQGNVIQASQTSTSGYTSWPIDDNGDGKPDRWAVDMSGDGKPDLYLVDQDGDGKPDYALVDRNQDGKPEARVIYGDRSKGECDVWEIDSNEDGVTDSIGMDYDYDGKPDVTRPN